MSAIDVTVDQLCAAPAPKKSVTIGIPTFNRPDLLRSALASASKQDYLDLKIVVSDNGGPQSTSRAIVADMQSRDARISYHAHSANIGGCGNVLWLAQNADTDLFMWLGDDDELKHRDHVSVLANVFERDALCRLSFPDVDVFFDGDKKTLTHGILSTHFLTCKTDQDYLRAWCKFGGGHPSYGLFDASHLRSMASNGGLQDKLVYFNEGLLLHRVFYNGGVRFAPGATLVYNGTASSTQTTPSRLMLTSFLRYSASVHALYVFSSLGLRSKAQLLSIIGRSHYPYIRTLLGKALRNKTGG